MRLPRKPAAVIFDMDGLILNTEVLSFEASVSAAALHGHELDWLFFKKLIGCSWPTIRQMMVDHFGPELVVDEFRSTWVQHYSDLLENRLEMKAGVVHLLDMLDRFEIPRAVATSSPREKALYKLEATELLPRYHHVVAQGDYAQGKPAPDPFLKAAALLETDPSECLALEDSHNGIRSANAAGMMTIMIPDLLEPTDEIAALCQNVLSDLTKVSDVIEHHYVSVENA